MRNVRLQETNSLVYLLANGGLMLHFATLRSQISVDCLVLIHTHDRKGSMMSRPLIAPTSSLMYVLRLVTCLGLDRQLEKKEIVREEKDLSV